MLPLPDRDSVISAIRASVDAAGGRRILMGVFLEASGMRKQDILRHFATWGEALRISVGRTMVNRGIVAARLLTDWSRVVQKLKRLPTENEYRLHGKHTLSTLKRQFPYWDALPGTFRAFAGDRPEWAGTLPFIDKHLGENAGPHGTAFAPRIRNRAACGVALDFGALKYEPVNEAGVIFLFGMLATHLGFMVEAMQAAFPDCQAKRRIAIGWQHVNIEFEYQSRNFHLHGHNAEACDLIVCWENNWPQCPVEIIALKDEIQKLTSQSSPLLPANRNTAPTHTQNIGAKSALLVPSVPCVPFFV